jgi:hypothetical protein
MVHAEARVLAANGASAWERIKVVLK